ncbi:unnamed protein product [Rodentolepis nana]|uniref:Fibronectin type-III domain-containing protein n=1 Tax=Rodentolepis nana TaxID=102285 RepID=A0A0R3T431_RODNA|nr:unnamed protein product [Rodentolepis nana]
MPQFKTKQIFFILEFTLFPSGPPSSPVDVTIDCTQAAKCGTALLSWTPGSENNAAITDVQIEYMTGYVRPLSNSPPEISQTNGLQTAFDSRAIFEALNVSLLTDKWQILKHELVEDGGYSSALCKTDKADIALINLTEKVALVPIYPDVAYQFRVRLINRVGISHASPPTPGSNEVEQSKCLLKPQAPTVYPQDLKIYGNVPNTLTVTWKPIPPIRHNGPGLRYHLNVKCLDCEQSSEGFNETEINNWNQSQIVFTKLPPFDLFSKQLPIEIFKQYEVSLIVSNALGLSKAGPAISKGWSAEYPPTIAPSRLRATSVDSSAAVLVWDWPSTDPKLVNGFFVGLRLEWCLNEKGQMCDRYKVTQDVRIAEPSMELYPHLRIDPSDSYSRKSEDFSLPNFTESGLFKSNPISYNQHRQAVLKNLPGLSHIRAWVRVLNIQYEGPSSEVILIHTKEGVPEAVSEFTHSFAGVNYVEVVWTKPIQTNGILTGYLIDVISDKGDCAKKNEACEFILQEKKISDPDQMATRIGGLEISTSYRLRIRALTAVGPGKPRELKVHTAKLKPAKSPAEFVVSPVYGSTNTLNVSLIRPIEISNNLNGDNKYPLLQRDDALLEPGSSSLIENTGQDGVRAFLVQFKKLQDEQWEETEKEFDKDWQLVGNLIPGEEYDMRVILTQSPSVSYVSQVRMLRVPRPGEIGFGLSGGVVTTLRENPQLAVGSGGVFGDGSLVLKIFVPLAVALFLIALIFTSLFCFRGTKFRRPMPRRMRAQKSTSSSIVAHRLNGCRVADENFISKKSQQYDHADNALKEYMEKETVIYMPIGTTAVSGTSNSDRNCVLQGRQNVTIVDSRKLKGWFDTSGINPRKQHCHVQHPSTSTFAPTRCLSPSFTLVPPMENSTPWQLAITKKENLPSERPI